MTDHVDVTVSDNPAKSRYEALVDGEVAGFVEYRLDGDAIDMHHTEVSDAYEGKGVGSRLAKGALDAVRERGLVVIPTCPFIKRYIHRHEDYAYLVQALPLLPSSRVWLHRPVPTWSVVRASFS